MTAGFPSPIEALRAAAKGQAFDEERAYKEIEAVKSSYNAAALYARVHHGLVPEDQIEPQVQPREAKKVLEPIVGRLKDLHKSLDAMEPDRWHDWQWIAADAYSELPDVRDELDRRNGELAEKYAGTDADLSDYVKSEVDQVGCDLGELRNIVAKVEPRLRAVFDAMMGAQGKYGRPPKVARSSLFRKLRAIYERDTDEKATARAEKSELGAYGPFVDFVVAVNREMRPPLPKSGLGTAVRNSLYPPKTKGSKGV